MCVPWAYVFVSIWQALGEYKVPPLRGMTYPTVCLFYFGWGVWGRFMADRDLNSHSPACTRTLVMGHPPRTPPYFLKPSFPEPGAHSFSKVGWRPAVPCLCLPSTPPTGVCLLAQLFTFVLGFQPQVHLLVAQVLHQLSQKSVSFPYTSNEYNRMKNSTSFGIHPSR